MRDADIKIHRPGQTSRTRAVSVARVRHTYPGEGARSRGSIKTTPCIEPAPETAMCSTVVNRRPYS